MDIDQLNLVLPEQAKVGVMGSFSEDPAHLRAVQRDGKVLVKLSEGKESNGLRADVGIVPQTDWEEQREGLIAGRKSESGMIVPLEHGLVFYALVTWARS